MNRMANMVIADLDAISVVNKGWGEQFKEAMNVNGGDVESAKMIDYIMHFFSFPWKVRHSNVLLKKTDYSNFVQIFFFLQGCLCFRSTTTHLGRLVVFFLFIVYNWCSNSYCR